MGSSVFADVSREGSLFVRPSLWFFAICLSQHLRLGFVPSTWLDFCTMLFDVSLAYVVKVVRDACCGDCHRAIISNACFYGPSQSFHTLPRLCDRSNPSFRYELLVLSSESLVSCSEWPRSVSRSVSVIQVTKNIAVKNDRVWYETIDVFPSAHNVHCHTHCVCVWNETSSYDTKMYFKC